jgi:hypothetical protein
MSIRDNIDWCQRQIDNVRDTLGGNKRGGRYIVNGEESSSRKAKATVASYCRDGSGYLCIRLDAALRGWQVCTLPARLSALTFGRPKRSPSNLKQWDMQKLQPPLSCRRAW